MIRVKFKDGSTVEYPTVLKGVLELSVLSIKEPNGDIVAVLNPDEVEHWGMVDVEEMIP